MGAIPHLTQRKRRHGPEWLSWQPKRREVVYQDERNKLSIYLATYLPINYRSLYLPICLSTYLPTYLSIYPPPLTGHPRRRDPRAIPATAEQKIVQFETKLAGFDTS